MSDPEIAPLSLSADAFICAPQDQFAAVAASFDPSQQITPQQVDAFIAQDYGAYVPLPTVPNGPNSEIRPATRLYNFTVAEGALQFIEPVSVATGEESTLQLYLQQQMGTEGYGGWTVVNHATSQGHSVVAADLPVSARNDLAFHEINHLYAHPRFNAESPLVWIEGADDFLTQSSMELRGNPMNHGYFWERAHFAGIASVVGNGRVLNAYYGGQVDEFKQALEGSFASQESYQAYYGALSNIQPGYLAPELYAERTKYAEKLFLEGIRPENLTKYEEGFAFSTRQPVSRPLY